VIEMAETYWVMQKKEDEKWVDWAIYLCSLKFPCNRIMVERRLEYEKERFPKEEFRVIEKRTDEIAENLLRLIKERM
jgi:hypothetical protein